MNNFRDDQIKHQIRWREKKLAFSKIWGAYNGKEYEHIIPKSHWEQNLWQGIRRELPAYIKENEIQPHLGKHNLLSSWVLCSNLYFPIRLYPDFSKIMVEFFQEIISPDITEITSVELEFAFEGQLSPANLLGEKNGNRGSGQTSPDVAFLINSTRGKGVILTECKYTEHSFYSCSARRTNDVGSRSGNPDPQRCLQDAGSCSYKDICHQNNWGRKYWDHLELTVIGKGTLTRCPAATHGYQLFRQHALANGIANNSDYSIVASAVAYDGRNESLINSLKTTGISDFSKGWNSLFKGDAKFRSWTHQAWVGFVRSRAKNDIHKD